MSGFTPETRDFYDKVGWRTRHGQTFDSILFGDRETGPVRADLQGQRLARVREALQGAGPRLKLLEAGCGGNPATGLLDLCSQYTGVDVSTTGLQLARARLRRGHVPFALSATDICNLPFRSGSFDAAYSAHVIYHILDPDAQRAAFREIARVVRPAGVAVFVLANPLPLIAPLRLAKGLIARSASLARLANRLRPKPPLPYKPMPIGWMREQLAPFGEVRTSCYALESVWFNQHVSEHGRLGKLLWRALRRGEDGHADHLTRFGTFVQMVLRKT